MELRSLRKEKRLTQIEAACVCGVSLCSYKNHELGRSKADSPLGKMMLERLAAYEPYDFTHGILPMEYIEEAIKKVCQDKAIDYVYLFGSYAKGEASEKSDVDLLVSGQITGLEFFSLGGELERALHKRVDVLRLADLWSNHELLTEIMATGIRIFEHEER